MSSSARDGKKSNHRLPYTIRYKLDHEEALRRLRFARYIELAKEVFGDVVSIVCIQWIAYMKHTRYSTHHVVM